MIPLKYEEIDVFSYGLVKAKLNGKWGFIDRKGTETVPFKYDEASYFRDGLAIVRTGNKWGMIDITGKEIIAPKYDNLEIPEVSTVDKNKYNKITINAILGDKEGEIEFRALSKTANGITTYSDWKLVNDLK